MIMMTIAILRATGFSQTDDEEYTFHIIQRGFADLILLEEKDTDKRYRIEYDNQYRHTEAIVTEIVEELRTREFDNHAVRMEGDEPIHWDYYTRIIQEICELIDHGIDSFELQGNLVVRTRQTSVESNSVVISLGAEIEAEFEFVKSRAGNTDSQ